MDGQWLLTHHSRMGKIFIKALMAGAGSMALLLPAGPAQAAGEWHEVPLPPLWPANFINDLAAAAPDSVWIGGGQGKFCILGWYPYGCAFSSPGNPVVRRWDGGKWREYPLRDLPSNVAPIDDVGAWGDEVWVHSHVQLDHPEYLARFDGTAFQKMPLPTDRAVSLSVNPAGVWLKRSTQYRWNGSGWTVTPMPDGVRGISGSIHAVSENEAWGLGVGADSGRDYSLVRWDGTSWSKVASLPMTGEWDTYSSIAVTGPGEVWALQKRPQDAPSRVYRWADGAFTEHSPSFPTQLTRLHVDGQGTLFASGYISTSPLTGGTLRFTGTDWVEEPAPAPGISPGSLISVPGTDPARTFTNS